MHKDRSTLRAQSTASNLAPVRQTRVAQTLSGSSQALILLASSGTSTLLSSSSVCVQVIVAISAPADVPVIIRGRRFAFKKALTTPKWSTDHIMSQSAWLHPLNLTICEGGPARETKCSETQIGICILKEPLFLLVG